jgi:hypothetical protein
VGDVFRHLRGAARDRIEDAAAAAEHGHREHSVLPRTLLLGLDEREIAGVLDRRDRTARAQEPLDFDGHAA